MENSTLYFLWVHIKLSQSKKIKKDLGLGTVKISSKNSMSYEYTTLTQYDFFLMFHVNIQNGGHQGKIVKFKEDGPK